MKPLRSAKTQGGAVLIVGLIVLLVATIIGVTAVRTNILQEKMAQNSNDLNLSFQAAESGLRDGEQWLQDLDQEPDRNLVTSCTANCGVWADIKAFLCALTGGTCGTAISYTDPKLWGWDDDGDGQLDYALLSGPSITVSSVSFASVSDQPRYTIAFQTAIRDSQNMGQQQDVRAGSYRNFYQVVAGGVGNTNSAKTYLEGVFARRF